MRHFNFETNIQERLPQGGKVFYVRRMTSDYAECFPFNVDEFIEDIYQKYQQMAADDPQLAAWAKTREELRQQWIKTLSVTRPSGDASIYPNRDGRQEPALMEVWHKAGDYWRRGLRIGDKLPQIVPPCRITRLQEGGWIALFPNEMHLLDESPLPKIDDDGTSAADDFDNGGHQCDTEVACGASPLGDDVEQVMEQEVTIKNIATATYHSSASPASEPFVTAEPRVTQVDIPAEQRRRRRTDRERQRMSYEERMEREAREAEQAARDEQQKKIFAAVGAVAVTLVMIHFFGLLGPAVFGLVCGGILKG